MATVAVDTANSVASMVLWGGVLTMALLSQTFFDDLTIPGTFYMFFALNLIGGIFVLFLMKETKGLTREQQAALYESIEMKNYSAIKKEEKLLETNY